MKLLGKIGWIIGKNIIGFLAVALLVTMISFLPMALHMQPSGAVGTRFAPTSDEMNITKMWSVTKDSSVYVTLKTPDNPITLQFTKIDGNAEFRLLNPKNIKANAKVDVTSLDSGNFLRDFLLKRSDQLDASAFPEASFQLKSVEKWPERWELYKTSRIKLLGALTLKGVSKDVVFDADVQYDLKLVKVRGTATINLQDFGIHNPETGMFQSDKDVLLNLQLSLESKGNVNLFELYKNTTVIDALNHDVTEEKRADLIKNWDQYHLKRVALIPPLASGEDLEKIEADIWQNYQKQPERFYPFALITDGGDAAATERIKGKLEQGCTGLSEFVMAPTYSATGFNLKWYPENNGRIYDLAVQYKTPIMLEFDKDILNSAYSPSTIKEITKRMEQEILKKHPNTTIILGHANMFYSANQIDELLGKNKNLYIDYFAGYNDMTSRDLSERQNKVNEYANLIKKYPDRFVLSSDSAFGTKYEAAYRAMFEMLDRVDEDTGKKLASGNFEKLMTK